MMHLRGIYHRPGNSSFYLRNPRSQKGGNRIPQLFEDCRFHWRALRLHHRSKGTEGKDTGRRGSGIESYLDRRQCTKFNGTSYISQRAAEAIYTPEGKEQVKATINYYMENAHFMRAELQKLGLRVYGGENAPYLWVKTPNDTPSWKFFEEMLYGASVVCTPGVGFGPSGEGYIRLTAFGEHEDCKEAMERIAKWLGK